ncbi:MAG: galactoside O-acetyltransferase [Thermoleophilia bacterium]|nr:galactoside O-acetyltransferase [Thermoleophilia bacterium]
MTSTHAPLGREELLALGIGSCGAHVAVDRFARLVGIERIHLAAHVRIDAFCVLSAGAGGIHVGNYVHVGAHGFMAGAGRIDIGDFATISGRVSIYSSSDDYVGGAMAGPMVPAALRDVDDAPVHVARHALVGAGSVLLPGVTVGEGASVGALSLVRADVEPFARVAGIPARRLGERGRGMLDAEQELLARLQGGGGA